MTDVDEDLYKSIGEIILHNAPDLIGCTTSERKHQLVTWARAVQEKLRSELRIQMYRGGDEIPGGIDSNLVMAYVEDPPSSDIARDLNLSGAQTCEHERAPCVCFCGVFVDPRSKRWTVIPMPWRLDWLARLSLIGGESKPGPRLRKLCGSERLTDKWLKESKPLYQRTSELLR